MYCRLILKILIKGIKLLFFSHLSFIAILKIDLGFSIRANALMSIIAIEINTLSALRRNMIFSHHVLRHRSVIRSIPISTKYLIHDIFAFLFIIWSDWSLFPFDILNTSTSRLIFHDYLFLTPQYISYLSWHQETQDVYQHIFSLDKFLFKLRCYWKRNHECSNLYSILK